MPPPIQSQPWPGNSALLLVHGVGSYQRQDYQPLLEALRSAVGEERWDSLAVYTALYDEINDWFAEKTQAAQRVNSLLAGFKARFADGSLGDAVAEGAGDVVWPVLSLNARGALRELLVAQIRQMVIDGDAAVRSRLDQNLYIVCHSLGCFHTYEALWAAATDPAQAIQPATDGVRFRSVVMVASPVQLIRTVAGDIHDLVPAPQGLATLGTSRLGIPSQRMGAHVMRSVERFVSLTGNLDPVGGYLFRHKLPWAYMNVPGQESFVEAQQIAGIDSEPKLADLLLAATRNHLGLPLTPGNPHDWTGYVTRNRDRVAQWLA